MKRTVVAGLVVGLPAVVLLARWQSPAPAAPPLLSLLPRGAVATSQARVELDGRAPFELAATVLIPAFPRASTDRAHGVVAGYDRWRGRWRVRLLVPLDGLPRALEAGPALGRREVVLFAAHGPDGRVQYRVFGHRWGRLVEVHSGDTAGGVEVLRGLIVERDPQQPRALHWRGWGFRPVPAPPTVPPAVVWYYWTDRNGLAHAQTNTVFLVPGQRVVPVRTGGGPTVLPIPDPNLDNLGGAFRARRPGTYRVTIPDFMGRSGASFQLTVEVADENS